MQIVAFDYGEKKIGVAVGQTETNTSSPLQIIFNKVEKFVKHLKTIYDAQYEYIDERLTTFEAKEILIENKSDIVDANAAKILIDNWFNKEL